MSDQRPRKRRPVLRALVAVIVVAVLGVAAWLGPTLNTLYKHGFFDSATARKYSGTTIDDLKAMRTALMIYHDSEGTFPAGDKWMDQIENRIHTSDMSTEESRKKLVDPAFAGQPGKYGFALNDAVAGKYKGDLKDPKTPLVFESSDSGKNAHGDPAKLAPAPPHAGGNLAITVDGTIVKIGA
jgi:hypothetical protein